MGELLLTVAKILLVVLGAPVHDFGRLEGLTISNDNALELVGELLFRRTQGSVE